MKEEVASIARMRSDFEHKLNARGSFPSDYARYAEYEMNLEFLRRKRVQRLGVVKSSRHAGQRRILFILERGTRKFHGDLGLWMQYIEYARKQKSYKKLGQIFSSVLRLHPTKQELWIYAAKYVLDTQADITEARSYMQRGLRFCKNSPQLWLEYAKLEMIYLAKIGARSKILGLDHALAPRLSSTDSATLPSAMEEALGTGEASDAVVDMSAEKLSLGPVLNGAIPKAIFDAAMKQFAHDLSLAERFFDLFAGFSEVQCTQVVIDHVLRALLVTAPDHVVSQSCHIRQPTSVVDHASADFPAALATSLERLKLSMETTSRKTELAPRVIRWLLDLLRTPDLDDAIRRVLSATLAQVVRGLQDAADNEVGLREDEVRRLIGSLREADRPKEAQSLLEFAAKRWGSTIP